MTIHYQPSLPIVLVVANSADRVLQRLIWWVSAVCKCSLLGIICLNALTLFREIGTLIF